MTTTDKIMILVSKLFTADHELTHIHETRVDPSEAVAKRKEAEKALRTELDTLVVESKVLRHAIAKGLITLHSENLYDRDPGTRCSWLQGHDKACDISNMAYDTVVKMGAPYGMGESSGGLRKAAQQALEALDSAILLLGPANLQKTYNALVARADALRSEMRGGNTPEPSEVSIRNQVLDEAVKACDGPVGGRLETAEWWTGYTVARRQCMAAIRSLKGKRNEQG